MYELVALVVILVILMIAGAAYQHSMWMKKHCNSHQGRREYYGSEYLDVGP